MDISVCIVNLNSVKQLEKCLNTLKSGIWPLSYEVIIVDNFSKDGSQNFIKTNFSNVRLISNLRNHGYTSEINKAMKIGVGRYKLILNPDSRLMPKSIVTLVSFLKKMTELES